MLCRSIVLLQELMSGLLQLRRDITTHSTNTSPTNSDVADVTSNLMNNAAATSATDDETNPSIRPQQLAAHEYALGLLSCQLEQLVAGAAAVKGALAAAGLLPGDGRGIRTALQQATAAGKLAEWASKGKAEAEKIEGTTMEGAQVRGCSATCTFNA
jgi:hypothetical protein